MIMPSVFTACDACGALRRVEDLDHTQGGHLCRECSTSFAQMRDDNEALRDRVAELERRTSTQRLADAVREEMSLARAEEREACAALCEQNVGRGWTPEDCAVAIRSRGPSK
jgi:predicted transcriptional regulator